MALQVSVPCSFRSAMSPISLPSPHSQLPSQVSLPSLGPLLSSLLQPTVNYLLTLQMPSGNFPASLESYHSDRLVHWCHGAPGFVHLMAHSHQVSPFLPSLSVSFILQLRPSLCLCMCRYSKRRATSAQRSAVGRWCGRGACSPRAMAYVMALQEMPTHFYSSTT